MTLLESLLSSLSTLAHVPLPLPPVLVKTFATFAATQSY